MKQDIENMADIRQLVDAFYDKVREDPLIGKLFTDKIQDWEKHLEKMYRFWQTVLLSEHTYHGSPFSVHATLPVDQEHFDRWVFLWHETVDGFFAGNVADDAKWRGDKMATMFLSKIEYYAKNSAKPIH